MRIPKGNFFSQSLVVLILSGFLFFSYALSRAGFESGGNTPPGRELPRRQASYSQYAALIAGIRTPQSILAPLESRLVWSEFAKSFEQNWEKYDRLQLAPMRDWAVGEELNGVLPFLLFFMAREKTRILDVEYWFMEPDGTIRKAPGFESGAPGPKGAIPGVKILFESASSPGNQPQTLYYFRLNLYNPTFRRNVHLINFLKSFGPFITFMKSAAFVMFDRQASMARRFVLDQSRYVLQEDSGIPFRYFDPSVWALQFFGTYSKPISFFKDDYQADLAKVYETGKNIKPLPFGIGYHFQVDTANLLFATRK